MELPEDIYLVTYEGRRFGTFSKQQLHLTRKSADWQYNFFLEDLTARATPNRPKASGEVQLLQPCGFDPETNALQWLVLERQVVDG